MRRAFPVLLLAAWAVAAPPAATAKSPSAAQILAKAEDVRNPERDYSVDFSIHGVSRGAKPVERDASYSMIASGKDKSLIVTRSPEMLYAASVLMVDDHAWMLLPKASKAWELSGAQLVNGDVASGDLARTNFVRGWTATLDGEDELAGTPCWRLALTASVASARYPKVVYRIAKKGSLPVQIDFFGRSGTLLKTVRYEDFRKGALGLRSMRLIIESFSEWKEATTLTFTALRPLTTDPAVFTPEGMMRVRDAAMAERQATGRADVALEQMVRFGGALK
jgi:hypothetical protein